MLTIYKGVNSKLKNEEIEIFKAQNGEVNILISPRPDGACLATAISNRNIYNIRCRLN